MPRVKKVTRIDRATARMLNEKAEQALTKVFASYGLTVERGNARFDAVSANLKFSVTVAEAAESVAENDSTILGFDSNIIGLTFTLPYKRSVYTIKSIHLNRPKYPIVAETSRGARYKFPVSTVAAQLQGRVKFTGRMHPPSRKW